jgi:hypothetical protein
MNFPRPTALGMFDREVTLPPSASRHYVVHADGSVVAIDHRSNADTFSLEVQGPPCDACGGSGAWASWDGRDLGECVDCHGTGELHRRVPCDTGPIPAQRIDVTDGLTPGARALVKQRTATAVRASLIANDLRSATDRAFRIGRAYEQGAKVRQLIGKTVEAREAKVRTVALEYLNDGDLSDVLRRELAVTVLAGFAGVEASPLLGTGAA